MKLIPLLALVACSPPGASSAPTRSAIHLEQTAPTTGSPSGPWHQPAQPRSTSWHPTRPDVVLPIGPPHGAFEKIGETWSGWTKSAPIGLRSGPQGELIAEPAELQVSGPGPEWSLRCFGGGESCEPTLSRTVGAVEEAWTLQDDRLWQRFLVAEGPSGTLTIPAGPRTGTPDGDTAFDVSGGQGAVRFEGAKAWDAHGVELRVRVAQDSAGIVYELEAAGAAYPILLDPWVVPAGQVLRADGFGYGNSFRSAADANGDGYDDLFVSRSIGANGIYDGGPSGIPAAQSRYYSGDNGQMWVPFDANGDGLGDFNAGCGSMWLLFGVAGGALVVGPQVPWPYASGWHGCSNTAIDVDGDGYDDIVVGETPDPYSASFVVYRGGPTLLSWTTVPPPTFRSYAPQTVSYPRLGAGDINGDGYGDVLMNLPFSPNNRTETFVSVFLGGPTGMQTASVWEATSHRGDFSEHIYWADIAEDVNGDGYDDVVISGAYTTAWWLPGGPDGLGDPISLGTWTPMCQDWGYCVAQYEVGLQGVGDVNDDGYNDLVLETGEGAGLVLGSPDGPVLPPYAMLDVSPHAGLLFANKVGDLNGDGYDELAVGAPLNYTRPDAIGYPYGTLFVWYSGPIDDYDNDGVLNTADCAPYRQDTHPGGTELAGTSWDEDCDGAMLCYAGVDADGDGSIGAVTVSLPFNPDGCVAAGGFATAPDCADADPNIGPHAAELADNDVDEDCDGEVACHADLDGDGYGSGAFANLFGGGACTAVATWDTDGRDCDDVRADVHPGLPDIPGVAADEDCDGRALCYLDADLDGAGVPAALVLSTDIHCVHPGMAATALDCDDADPNRYPGAPVVVADDVDDNCDGNFECYYDHDHDGYGAQGSPFETPERCGEPSLPSGVVRTSRNNLDCNTSDARTYPGAPEWGYYGDMNCDGLETCTLDEDGDGDFAMFGPATLAVECPEPRPAYYERGDCDDHDPRFNNGVVETPGDPDYNCEGYLACYVDDDDDGYGILQLRSILVGSDCVTEPLVAVVAGDCDDADPTTHPGGTEVVADRVDQDCNDRLACWVDADHDGVGSSRVVQRNVRQCAVAGLSDTTGDCDDAAAAVKPGVLDRNGDGVDADCDGVDGLRMTIDDTTRALVLRAQGAGARARVTFTVSTQGVGAGPCPPALGGACAGVLSPRVVHTATADAAGVATVTVTVPALVPAGAHLAWQAWVTGPALAEGSPPVQMTVP